MALRGVPGFCHIVRADMAGANLSRGVARIAPKPGVNPRYLLWALRSFHTQRAIRQYANGWKGEDLREITIAQLRALPMPSVPRARQDEIAQQLDDLQATRIECRNRHDRFRQTLSMLTERALGASA
jgi:type I restriction enzyme S subunit